MSNDPRGIRRVPFAASLVMVLFGALATGHAQAQQPRQGVIFLDQAWSQADREWYYQFSQGSTVIPYDVFLNLEVAGGQELFRSDANSERFGLTFEGGNFWLSAGGGIPFATGYNPRLGVPVYGSGLRIDRIFAPSIAQKITIDLEQLGVPQFGVVQLLPSEQIGAAAQQPGGLSRLIDTVRADLEGGIPQGG